MRLSAHFSLEELIHSETARRKQIANEPGAPELANLTDLCNLILEPSRELVGPLVVNSGYRCEALNKIVKGVGKTLNDDGTVKKEGSAHMYGRAADVTPIDMQLEKAFDLLRGSDIPFDQIILEPGWLHLGMAKHGVQPRRQALIATRTTNGMAYHKAEEL